MTCSKCGACCKFITFNTPNKLTKDLQTYYRYHNCKVKWDGRVTIVTIPLRCKHLSSNNLCKIFDRRPDICRNTANNPKAIKPINCTDR